MPYTANQIHSQVIGKARTHSLGFANELDTAELMTGTPIILETTTSTLTITNKKVNTATIDINGVEHLAGKALQCSVVGDAAGTYEITWKCSTDSTPSQDMYGRTIIIIEDE